MRTKQNLFVSIAAILLSGVIPSFGQSTWTGAVDSNWNEAGNWNPNGVPFGTDVRFDDTAPSASINVPPGVFVSRIEFANNTNAFTFSGGDIDVIFLESIGTATNEFQTALVIDIVNVFGGTINLLNANNTSMLGEPLNIHGGTLGVTTAGSASGIGNAPLSMAGGRVEFLAGGKVLQPGLEERWYNLNDFACGDGAALFDALHAPLTTNNVASFLNRVPDTVRSLDGPLDYTGAQMNTRSGGIVGTELVGGFWQGNLNVGAGLLIEPGDVTFGTRSDDGSVVWLDINQNGTFDDLAELVVDNRLDHGAQNRVGTVNLAAGAYAIGIGFWERCGGEFMGARIAQGAVAEADYNTMAIINPADAAQAGLWTQESIPLGTLSNEVRLLADSTIALGTNLFSHGLGDLIVTNASRLHLESAQMGQQLLFTNVVLNSDLTLSQTNMATITLPNINETTSAGLTVEGDGIVFLTTSNNYSGVTLVAPGGTLDVSAAGALGGTNGFTEVQAGGSLSLSGTFDYQQPEPLFIAGAGSPKSSGALNHAGGGNTEWRGPITLSGDATMRNGGNILSVHNLIDNGGFELTFDVIANDIQIEGTAAITGSGDIRLTGGNARLLMFDGAARSDFTGNLTIENAIWDARGSDSLGTADGFTRVLDPGRLELRDGRTWADDLFVSGSGRNNGSIFNVNNNNTLTGLITLEGDTFWRVVETSLVISNRIDGAFQLTKRDTGTLVLTEDNNMANYVHESGEVRIRSAGAFGATTNLNVQHAALEFDGNMVFDASGPLHTIVIGNTTFAPLSGTTVLDVAIDASTTHVFSVVGDGDLEIHQPFGTPGLDAATNALNHYGYHINNDNFAMNLAANRGMINGGHPRLFDGLHEAVYLENGPGDRGLDFNNDADFVGSGAVAQNDNFSNLFLGYLNVTNGAAGSWVLRVEQRDDPVGMWIDLNQNGVFESTVGGLGSNRGEQLAWNNDTGIKQVDLVEGRYLIAFTHREGGGGSGIDINFQSPLMGAEATVKPGDPTQAGIWTPFETYNSNLIKDGAGTLTLGANNNYSGETQILGGAIVVRNAGALGDASAGTVIAAHAELGLSSNVFLDTNVENLDFGACSTLANIDGDNQITNFLQIRDGESGRFRLRSDEGTLELESIILQASGLSVAGHGDVIVSGTIQGAGSATNLIPGLRVAIIDLDASANGVPNVPADREALIEPVGGNLLPMEDLIPAVVTNLTLIDFGAGTETVAGDGTVLDRGGSNGNPFGGLGINVGVDRHAGLFTGFLEIPEDGTYAITTRSDDGSRAWLDISGDGCFDETELVAENQGHHGMVNRSQGPVELTAGYYGFKATWFEGGGGSGMQVSWEHPTGDNPFPREIITNAFYSGTVAVNDVVKEGSGTLTLGQPGFVDFSINNLYGGGTRVLDGVLTANLANSSTGSSEVRVEQHGQLGGLGSVNNHVLIGPGGALAPGESPGQLTVAGGDVTFTSETNNPAWFVVELDGPANAGIDYDQLLMFSGIFNASNGTLLATHGAGYDPQNGEVLTIVDADNVTGTFTNLPDGASVNASGEEFIINYNMGAGRNTITLSATGIDLLYAGPDLVFREEGQPLTFPVADLLGNDSASVAGGPLAVTGVQTQTVNGATVTLANNEITYTVTNTFNSTDTFEYTLTDAGVGTIQGVVTVVVVPAATATPPIADLSGLVVIGGKNQVTFLGDPGQSYVIEYTDDLTANPVVWTPISGTLTPDSGGGFSVEHESFTPISYYRARVE